MPRRSVLVLVLVLFVAFFVANVSRPADQVQGCLACVNEPPTAHLRVLVFNMLHGFPGGEARMARADRLVATMQDLGVDVALLQEVSHTGRDGHLAAYVAERVEMNWVYARANGHLAAIGFEEGEAILSRFPLEDVRFTELLPQAGMFEHRIALEATLRTQAGKIRLVSVHLTDGDPQVNRAQARALQAFVADRSTPALIGGDFNALPESATMRTLRQTWQWVPPPPSVPTCCVDVFAPPTATFSHRIDAAFLANPNNTWYVASGVRTLDTPQPTAHGWLWPSDHAGLLLDLQTNPME